MITEPKDVKPKRCLSKFSGMRCERNAGHLLHGVPHASGDWRWNSRLQWTEPPMIASDCDACNRDLHRCRRCDADVAHNVITCEPCQEAR